MKMLFIIGLLVGNVSAQTPAADFLFGIDIRMGRDSEIYEAFALENGRARMVYRNSSGQNKSRILEKADADYLLGEIKALPKRSHSYGNCPRAYASFRLPQRIVVACTQSREELAVRSARIIELLRFL